MANNIAVPRFGRTGTGVDEWGAETFDVDLLTEFLLEESNPSSGGISFDFNMDNSNHGSMISPENSEDGAMPPLADQGVKYGTHGISLGHMAGFPNQVPNMSSIDGFNEQALNAKRRRVDAPMMAMTTGTAPQHMLNNQQLMAAAAAQAMQGRGNRKKNQAQIDRRRERNRILARRTRLRKKFFFESLQKEIMDLQRENQMLKDVVKTNIEGEAQTKILEECSASESIPQAVLEACGENSNDMDAQDFSLVQSIRKSQHSFIITDPSLQDNPIVFASDDFLQLTGYTREQVLGRNCRFLQGTDTDPEKVEEIRKALSLGEDVSVTFLNYKADGTPFWNKLFIAALRDAQNNIVNFIGVAVKVTGPELEDGDDDDDDDYEGDGEDSKQCADTTAD